jgi:hypothetical protein
VSADPTIRRRPLANAVDLTLGCPCHRLLHSSFSAAEEMLVGYAVDLVVQR